MFHWPGDDTYALSARNMFVRQTWVYHCDWEKGSKKNRKPCWSEICRYLHATCLVGSCPRRSEVKGNYLISGDPHMRLEPGYHTTQV